MKTHLLAVAAAVGLAIAAPSFAFAKTTDQGKTTTLVNKQKLVLHKRLRAPLKLNCEKPVVVKGVKQCPQKDPTQNPTQNPTQKDATPPK